ncbi:hypothetical protein HPB48_000345 [Haemaphysalis longicornis]|uniref:Uncharacterized protein n=1 Tax=Haemaphysalis longicornis TaxID=44386 RepID=A0A9J6FYB5_HAELO|nr:hypothetical protein HPB48_000345 [Haemaphysalis longicornis]
MSGLRDIARNGVSASELICHNDIARGLCHENKLGPCVRFISHAFEELPLRRFLAFDGLHTSFEGVGLLAQHFQAPLTSRAPLLSRKIPTSCSDGGVMGGGSDKVVAPSGRLPTRRATPRQNRTSPADDAPTSRGHPVSE